MAEENLIPAEIVKKGFELIEKVMKEKFLPLGANSTDKIVESFGIADGKDEQRIRDIIDREVTRALGEFHTGIEKALEEIER